MDNAPPVLLAAGAVEEAIVEALLVEVVLANHLSKQLIVDLLLQTDSAEVLAALPGRRRERRESLFDAHAQRTLRGATIIAVQERPNEHAHHNRRPTEREEYLLGDRSPKPDDDTQRDNQPTYLNSELNETQFFLRRVDGDCGCAPGSEALSMSGGGGAAPGSEALSMSGGGHAQSSEVLSISGERSGV
eukprot:CAMPEP_0204190304 /NCGR_PEP_ID=MMETSP0361-20130328/59200_1 /ASSEMBLY_ACC=CAM_ASM_000343 /TAXON_ID=268821 /ORGANISM="Scrippsiella Hangoei, Strain SHTV-5" /LENGTH=188 /DNA_ID=CAMNT_0051151099 /DNA_START=659 /DNA_END=1224 /DNA_ORIENTATION=-